MSSLVEFSHLLGTYVYSYSEVLDQLVKQDDTWHFINPYDVDSNLLIFGAIPLGDQSSGRLYSNAAFSGVPGATTVFFYNKDRPEITTVGSEYDARVIKYLFTTDPDEQPEDIWIRKLAYQLATYGYCTHDGQQYYRSNIDPEKVYHRRHSRDYHWEVQRERAAIIARRENRTYTNAQRRVRQLLRCAKALDITVEEAVNLCRGD